MDDKTRKSFEEDLDKFIKKAKKKGVTEYQDVVNVFNKYELTEEEFDLVWNALDKNSIVLSSPVDDAPDSELDEIDEESEEIEKEIEDLDKDSSLDENAAMADSVHMYLKEIGSVELLTMEEEIELAKRIEAGKAAREENEKLAEKIEGLKKAFVLL